MIIMNTHFIFKILEMIILFNVFFQKSVDFIL